MREHSSGFQGGKGDSNVGKCLGSRARSGEEALIISLPQGCQIDLSDGDAKPSGVEGNQFLIGDKLEFLAGGNASLLHTSSICYGPHDRGLHL